jgi:hypothetical protein
MSKIEMNGPNEKPRRYKWPWFVLAAFLLGVALAVLWMIFDVQTIEQERNLNTPPATNSAP